MRRSRRQVRVNSMVKLVLDIVHCLLGDKTGMHPVAYIKKEADYDDKFKRAKDLGGNAGIDSIGNPADHTLDNGYLFITG